MNVRPTGNQASFVNNSNTLKKPSTDKHAEASTSKAPSKGPISALTAAIKAQEEAVNSVQSYTASRENPSMSEGTAISSHASSAPINIPGKDQAPSPDSFPETLDGLSHAQIAALFQQIANRKVNVP